MNFKLKNPFKVWDESCAKRQLEEDIEQVYKAVQLREFEGKIWLCFKNVPIVEQSQLKNPVCDAVAECRNAVCRYFRLNKEVHEKSRS